MFRYFLFVVMILMTGFSAQPTSAQDPSPPRPGAADAQKIIDACWAVSEKDRDSMSIAIEHRGADDTADCLEKNILAQLPLLFGRELAWERLFKEHLHQLRNGYLQFYLSVNSQNKFCPCGTIYGLHGIATYDSQLEEMLRDVIATEAEYNLKPSFASMPK